MASHELDYLAELMADLEERTGLKINRIEIGRIDFLRDVARIRIYYFEDLNSINMADEEDSIMSDDDDD